MSGYADDLSGKLLIHILFHFILLHLDPDEYDDQNSGFKIRQKIFCVDDDVLVFGKHIVPLYVSLI